MKKNLLYTFMAIGCLSLASCGEDDLTPSIDISPEYEANLALTKSSIHADTVIYKWYQKYNTAILYKFNDNDPTWLWSSKLTNGFKKFDISNREDSIAVEEMVDNLKRSCSMASLTISWPNVCPTASSLPSSSTRKPMKVLVALLL